MAGFLWPRQQGFKLFEESRVVFASGASSVQAVQRGLDSVALRDGVQQVKLRPRDGVFRPPVFFAEPRVYFDGLPPNGQRS
jgi:hypothetical protein